MKLMSSKFQGPKIFYPGDIPAVKTVHDARYGVVLSGGEVSSWANNKGGGAAASISGLAGGSGDKPIVVANDVGALPSILTDSGSNGSWLQGTSAAWDISGEVWMFGLLNSRGVNPDGVLEWSNSSGNQRGVKLNLATNFIFTMMGGSLAGAGTTLLADATSADFTGARIFVIKWDSGATNLIRINGVQVGSGGGNIAVPSGGTPTLSLGRQGSIIGEQGWSIFGVASALTTSTGGDVERIEGYLAWECGLPTSLLPSGHTYRSARPK